MINITTEFITLAGFLKLTNMMGSGGEAKIFLRSNDVEVNGEKETRRNRKLYKGDKITVNGEEFIIS